MRYIVIMLFFVFGLSFTYRKSVLPTEASACNKALKWFGDELYSLNSELDSMCVYRNQFTLQLHYKKARVHYKRIELFVEYFYPRPAKFFVNGPLVPKYDEALGNIQINPNGFQSIEAMLFANANAIDSAILNKEIRALQQHLVPMFSTNYYAKLGFSDGMLLEMCQIELFRIVALNLNGYDETIVKDNVEEAYAALEGIEYVVGAYSSYTVNNSACRSQLDMLLKQIESSKSMLRAHTDYDSFERLTFIRKAVLPVNKSIIAFHNQSALPWTKRMQAIDLQQPNLFSQSSFNLQFFAPYNFDTTARQKKIELGRLLFFDPILSGDGKRSCASCHNPNLGFGDAQTKSIAMHKDGRVARNAPPLFNVGYQNAFFDDGRAFSLEQQVSEVIHNKVEMNSSLKDVCEKLKWSKKYIQLFADAFPETGGNSLVPMTVQQAIAEYERSLVSMNSRFDAFIDGNENALSQQEQHGYTLFAGKALCGSCHFFPLFSGIVPPLYAETEFEVIGVPASAENNMLDADSGRAKISKLGLHLHAFKTPTVRNVSATAPFMHNGIYTRLEDVIEFYQKGGGAGLGLNVPNQTLPFDSLSLNVDEKADIVLFLKSLTDVAVTKQQKPTQLPDFESHPEWNNRRIGGEY